MKQDRQNMILQLINSYEVYTQDELIARLKENGFEATQATISRDIRELGLSKKNTPNGQKYIAPSLVSDTSDPMARVFRDGLVSVDYAGNMLVLHTLSGMAAAVALALDSMKIKDILGSVAGDDVVMCVVRSEEKAAEIVEKLGQ